MKQQMDTASDDQNVSQESPHHSSKPRRNSINNVNTFKKTGMVAGSLLQYFTKSPKLAEEPETTATKSVVNEISQIGKELLKRCESPEIVYLGTFPTSSKSDENQSNYVNVDQDCPFVISNISSLATDNVQNSSVAVENNNNDSVVTSNTSTPSDLAQDITAPSGKSIVDGESSIISLEKVNFIKEEDPTTVESNSRNKSKLNIVTPQQKQKTNEAEEKENNNNIDEQQSSPLIISENIILDSAENNHTDTIELPSNNHRGSQLGIKMNAQQSRVSVVLPSFGSVPSKDDHVKQQSKINVTDFYKTKKRRSSLNIVNPVNQKKRKFGETNNEDPQQQANSPQLDPSKIAKRRRSSGSSSSSSKQNLKISISKDPVQMSSGDSEKILLLIEKMKFKDALNELSAKLDEQNIPVYPNAEVLAEIINNCIFGRTSRDVHATACIYFEKLMAELTISVELQNLYEDAFTSILNPGLFVDDLLRDLTQDLSKKPEEKFTLQFFKAFTSLLFKEYVLYSEKSVKLRHPLIAVLMSKSCSSDALPASEFNEQWKKFLTTVIKLPPHSEEAQATMKWIAIAGQYFPSLAAYTWTNGYQRLVDFFVTQIIGLQDYGLQFLKLLGSEPLALDVCVQLLCNHWKFNEDKGQWNKVLYELSAHILDSTMSSRVNIDQHQQVPEPKDSFSRFVMEKVNMKGESRLHLACGQKKTCSYEGNIVNYKQILRNMRIKGSGDINIRDNANNTPLHEVCYHGNTDVLTEIWHGFSDKNKSPGPQRVDMLAQNIHGETALHNAVDRKNEDCIHLLLLLAQYLECESQLLKVRNKDGSTAWDLIKDAEDNERNERIKNMLGPRSPHNRKTFYAGVKLPDAALDDIESNMPLRHLIMYWRKVHDILNPAATCRVLDL